MNVNLREVVAAIIAALVIIVFCLIILFQIVNGKPVVIPDSLLALVSLIVGVYYGQHASTNGAYAAGAIAANTAAATVAEKNATTHQPAP